MAPLAGRPPFATNEPDSYYEPQPGPQRRYRQPGPPNPNDRTSAYAMYDDYLNDFDPNNPKSMSQMPSKHLEAHPSSKHVLLAAAAGVNSNSYVAPIASFDLTQPNPAVTAHSAVARRQPPPAHNPFEPQPQQQNPFEDPRRIHFQPPHPNHHSPHPHLNGQTSHYGTASPIPSVPHPLQPPMTPITPAFLRPSKEFKSPEEEPIMRSKAEDTVLPSRGQRGDDFWRRFSMVIHEQEKSSGKKKSTWLSKTQNGKNMMSRWLWLIGIILILVIGGAIGLGWWVSHNHKSQTQPSTLGGSAKETGGPVPKTTATASSSSKSVPHVSPTLTVDRRMLSATQ
ncbi:hypothetical protein E1B28_012230 [Marasmius oreades]|uniref:Uncharacterized protein n=1 Tax=Marasmius oreades TaxID=181124 RepID=A0A9P7RSD7_9AGAR|nr:uncharacterized protein E1B28_012230 [Marasmius oreades]KAG7088213.1 hypothetical protein E1B28_012230 [Marasmius oreades]